MASLACTLGCAFKCIAYIIIICDLKTTRNLQFANSCHPTICYLDQTSGLETPIKVITSAKTSCRTNNISCNSCTQGRRSHVLYMASIIPAPTLQMKTTHRRNVQLKLIITTSKMDIKHYFSNGMIPMEILPSKKGSEIIHLLDNTILHPTLCK